MDHRGNMNYLPFRLGSLVTSDAKSDQRIGIAKTVFKGISDVLTARDINNQTKLRLIKCYIWSTMFYGCDTWTISEAMKKQLEAAEKKCGFYGG